MVLPPVLLIECIEGYDFAFDRPELLVRHVSQGQCLPELISHGHDATVAAYTRRGELMGIGIISLYELQHVCSGRVLEARGKGSQPRHSVAAPGAKELFVANLVGSPHCARLRRTHARASLEQCVKFLAKEVVAGEARRHLIRQWRYEIGRVCVIADAEILEGCPDALVRTWEG